MRRPRYRMRVRMQAMQGAVTMRAVARLNRTPVTTLVHPAMPVLVMVARRGSRKVEPQAVAKTRAMAAVQDR